jgi:hypothetical protein
MGVFIDVSLAQRRAGVAMCRNLRCVMKAVLL